MTKTAVVDQWQALRTNRRLEADAEQSLSLNFLSQAINDTLKMAGANRKI